MNTGYFDLEFELTNTLLKAYYESQDKPVEKLIEQEVNSDQVVASS